MDFSIVIPYRPGGDKHRERAFEFIKKHYERAHRDCELIVADAPTDEWSKGAAVNAGVAKASGEGLILADADSWVAEPDVRTAMEMLRLPSDDNLLPFPQWCVPHGNVFRLNEDWTQKVYAGAAPRATEVVRYPYLGLPGGGINVLTRYAFDAVNGMDPRFLGWGGEDLCFGIALTTMKYYHWRGTAPLWHLYHPHPAPTLRGSPESETLVALYKAAERRPGPMRELLFSR